MTSQPGKQMITIHITSVPTMSLIYTDKFEFEYPTIMDNKHFTSTEQFLVMAKGSDYFLSLDDKSKRRYKVKINTGYHSH